MLVIVVATVAVSWIAKGPVMAVSAAGWLLAFVLLIHFGRRRSDVIDVISGIGDERSRLLYTRAVAFAGHVICLVVVVWWLWTEISGTTNETLSVIGVIAGLSFLAGAIYYSRRG
jgi:hypothetical protein